jgi:excisionase family DNA binding protein
LSTYSRSGHFSPGEWISQAEAARLRNVTRQAIAKLVKSNRIRTLEVGGHVLVNKEDILRFEPKPAGRPKTDQGQS